MPAIDPADPLAVAVTEAIHAGDLAALRRLLDDNPGLVTARIGDDGPGGTTRLVERGARTTIVDAATLGLLDRLEGYFAGPAPPSADAVDHAFWGACHGGQRPCAEYLLERGRRAGLGPGLGAVDPLDAAARSGADDLVRWLRARGARSAAEPAGGDPPA